MSSVGGSVAIAVGENFHSSTMLPSGEVAASGSSDSACQVRDRPARPIPLAKRHPSTPSGHGGACPLGACTADCSGEVKSTGTSTGGKAAKSAMRDENGHRGNCSSAAACVATTAGGGALALLRLLLDMPNGVGEGVLFPPITCGARDEETTR